jgi:hypothetical protein
VSESDFVRKLDVDDSLAAAPSANRQKPDAPPSRLRLTALSQVRRTRVEPLLPGLNIPLRTLSVVCGRQGLGKSAITCEFTGRLTRDGYGVIFLAEEDEAGAVIRPRLEAADADLDRVFTVDAVRDAKGRGVLLPRDTDELGRLAKEENVRLVVIDPWTNHLDVADVDKGNVRDALMPVVRVARAVGLVVLLVAHPTKRADGDPLDQIAHASAVSQIARSAYFLTLDPEAEGGADPKKNPHRLLTHCKSNLMPYGQTLRYRIETRILPADGDQPEVATALAVPAGTSDLDYLTIREQVRRLQNPIRDDRPTAQGNATSWLRDYLADGQPHDRDALLTDGEEAGHAPRTVQRAARTMGVTQTRQGWALSDPDSRQDAMRMELGADGANGAEKTPAPSAPTSPSFSRQDGWRDPVDADLYQREAER